MPVSAGLLASVTRATVVRLALRGGPVATAIVKADGDHVPANLCGLAFLEAAVPGAGPRLLASFTRPTRSSSGRASKPGPAQAATWRAISSPLAKLSQNTPPTKKRP